MSVRTRGLAILTGCSAMTQHGIVLVLLGPLLPNLMQELGVRESLAGLMLGAGSLGFVLGPLLGGRLVDRRGVSLALLVGFGIEIVILLAFGVVPAFLLAVGLNLLKGFGASFVETALNVLPVTLSQDSAGRRASLMNLMHTFFGVGALVAPAAVALLIQQTGSWRPAFFGAAGVTAVVLVLAASLRLPHAFNNGREGERTLLSGVVREPLVLAGAAALFLYIGAESGMTGWIVLYLQERLKLAPAVAGIGLTLMWCGIMAGRIVSAVLARMVPIRTLVLAAASGGFAAGCLLLSARSAAAAFPLLFLFGFVIAGIFPNVMVTINARFPGRTGKVTAFLTIASSAGSMSVHPIIGALAQGYGITAAVLVPSSLLALLLLTYTFTIARMAGAR